MRGRLAILGSSYRTRELRLCYLNIETRVIDAGLARFEHLLKQIGTVRIDPVSSLDDKNLFPCDLLIIAAGHLPEEDFHKWLSGLTDRIKRQNAIWIPSLIVAPISFTTLADDIMPFAIDENWYFDVIDPDHLDSLPMRVANLLRIHDHLHELSRYEKSLADLQADVRQMQQKLEGDVD